MFDVSCKTNSENSTTNWRGQRPWHAFQFNLIQSILFSTRHNTQKVQPRSRSKMCLWLWKNNTNHVSFQTKVQIENVFFLNKKIYKYTFNMPIMTVGGSRGTAWQWILSPPCPHLRLLAATVSRSLAEHVRFWVLRWKQRNGRRPLHRGGVLLGNRRWGTFKYIYRANLDYRRLGRFTHN